MNREMDESGRATPSTDVSQSEISENLSQAEDSEKACCFHKEKMRIFYHVMFRHRIVPLIIFILVTCIGAGIFQAFEGNNEVNNIKAIIDYRQDLLGTLWTLAVTGNLTKEEWVVNATRGLQDYQVMYKALVQPGFLPHWTVDDQMWTFWGSFVFCITVCSTIGYGFMTPKTPGGRAACLIYAGLSIPLCMIILANLAASVNHALYRLSLQAQHTIKPILLCQLKCPLLATNKVSTVDSKISDGGDDITSHISEAENQVHSLSRRVHFRDDNSCRGSIVHISPHRTLPDQGNSSKESNSISEQMSSYHMYHGPAKRQERRFSLISHAGTQQPHARRVSIAGPFAPVMSSYHADNESSSEEEGEELYQEEMGGSDYSEEEEPSTVITTLALLVYVVIGACILKLTEKWSMLDCFYFLGISVTTIGFGDINPQDMDAFLGVLFYIFIGLPIVSVVINKIHMFIRQFILHETSEHTTWTIQIKNNEKTDSNSDLSEAASVELNIDKVIQPVPAYRSRHFGMANGLGIGQSTHRMAGYGPSIAIISGENENKQSIAFR